MAKLGVHQAASLTRYAVAKRIVQYDVLPKAHQMEVEEEASSQLSKAAD